MVGAMMSRGSVSVLAWGFPLIMFLAALGVALGASAWFTSQLEDLSAQWRLSPGLLGLISALGANIPNYVASLTAFVGGQELAGLGIIVGSNIYNIAVILALVAFATPGRHGISLTFAAMRDVRHVAWIVAAMTVPVWISFFISGIRHLPATSFVAGALQFVSLMFFAALMRHAMQRIPHSLEALPSGARHPRRPPTFEIILTVLALALALVGVIVMVQAGYAFAGVVHLPPAILSLVVLAIATSLPNTVVAFQLARTARASASVEEVLSSNAINLALGCSLPLLIWPARSPDGLMLWLDLPLLLVLELVALARIRSRHIPWKAGVSFLAIYGVWVILHMLV